jgi:hypothetical protein
VLSGASVKALRWVFAAVVGFMAVQMIVSGIRGKV